MKIAWGRSIGFNLELNKNMEYTIVTDGAGCYPWTEFFVLWPRTTITGKKIFWEKAFKRRVWVVWGTGFHMEPEIEYATLFEIISDDNNEN
jgi:hypothetical protein